MRLAAVLLQLWIIREHFSEGLTRGRRPALVALGSRYYRRGDYAAGNFVRARICYKESLAIFRGWLPNPKSQPAEKSETCPANVGKSKAPPNTRIPAPPRKTMAVASVLGTLRLLSASIGPEAATARSTLAARARTIVVIVERKR